LAVLVAGPLSFSSPSRGQGNPLETLREISDSSKGKPGIEGADAARTDEERHGAGDDVEPSETSKRADIKKPSEVAKTVWEYPLFRSGTAEDGQPTYVHLNDLLIAILTFTLIFVGLRWLIRLGLGKIFKWSNARGSTQHIVQKAVSVTLIVVGAILAMVVGGLPWGFMALTLGLLAIGMTLGAQKLLGNYLSGFIIASERVAEPGDCVEVDGEVGYVLGIRGRYTRVRRFDGIDVLIPNSRILETAFVNWHGENNQVRDQVTMSVVYHAPVEEVIEILETLCLELDAILSEPKPVALLRRFDDSGICFEVYYWTNAKSPTELWVVSSNLRRTIYSAFRDAGIDFAFPQRELHLRDNLAKGAVGRARRWNRGRDVGEDNEAAASLSGRDAAEKDAGTGSDASADESSDPSAATRP